MSSLVDWLVASLRPGFAVLLGLLLVIVVILIGVSVDWGLVSAVVVWSVQAVVTALGVLMVAYAHRYPDEHRRPDPGAVPPFEARDRLRAPQGR